jgi:hypothetical protein
MLYVTAHATSTIATWRAIRLRLAPHWWPELHSP